MLTAGDRAPDFMLPGPSGTDTSLADAGSSGPVLLAFFKISCPTCQYTFPFLERLAAAPELRTIGISQNDLKATAEFCRTYGITFPVIIDDAGTGYRVSNDYKITHVPSLFLIEGNAITEAFSGFSRHELERIGQRFHATVFRTGEKTPDFRPG